MDPTDPESFRMMSAAMQRMSKDTRSSNDEVARLKESFKRAKDAGRDMGAAVVLYVNALNKAIQSGSSDVKHLQNAIRALHEAAPEAYKKETEAINKLQELRGRSYSDDAKGMAARSERIKDVIKGYQELTGSTKKAAEAAFSANVGASGVGGMYTAEGKLGNLQEDMRIRRAMKDVGLSTESIDKRIATSRLIQSKLNKQVAGETELNVKRSKRAAESSVAGMNKMMGKKGEFIGDTLSRISQSKTGMGKSIRGLLFSEKAAAKGVAPGLMAGATSTALGSLAKTLGPLSASLSGTAILANLVMGAFSGMSEASKVAGNQIRASAMRGKESMGMYNFSMIESSANIRRFAGVANLMGYAADSAITKKIIPAAQKGLLAFNTLDRSTSTIDSWAGALAGAAVDGQTMGMSYESSIRKISSLADVFGNSASKTRRGFQDMLTAARRTALTYDQVALSMGNLESLGSKFGVGGISAIPAAGQLMAGTKMSSGAQRRMALGSVGKMMNNMPKLLSLASVRMGTKGAISAYVDAIRGGTDENRGARMVAFTARAMSGISGPGGIKGLDFEGLASPDRQHAWKTAMGMGYNLGVDPSALLDPKFAKGYEDFLDAPSKDKKDALDAKEAELTGDYTKKGMMSIVEQQGTLLTILNSINRIGNIIATFGASRLFKGLGPFDVETRVESMETNFVDQAMPFE